MGGVLWCLKVAKRTGLVSPWRERLGKAEAETKVARKSKCRHLWRPFLSRQWSRLHLFSFFFFFFNINAGRSWILRRRNCIWNVRIRPHRMCSIPCLVSIVSRINGTGPLVVDWFNFTLTLSLSILKLSSSSLALMTFLLIVSC